MVDLDRFSNTVTINYGVFFKNDLGIAMISSDSCHDDFPDLLIELTKEIFSPFEYVKILCNYFGAISGVLWFREKFSVNEFQARAYYKREDFEKLAIGSFFNLDAPNSITSIAIKKERIIHGIVGKKPFDDTWLGKNNTKYLKQINIKEILISPIINDTIPFGSISLYFDTTIVDAKKNMSKLEIINKLTLILFGKILKESENLETNHRKAGHEITSSLSQIEGSLNNLDRNISSTRDAIISLSHYTQSLLFSKDKERFEHSLSSLKKNVSSIKRCRGDMSNATQSIHSSIIAEKVFLSILENKKNARVTSFEKIYLSATQPLIKQIRRDQVILSPLRSNAGEFWIKIAPVHLHQIITNYMSNAIKYAAYSSVVYATIKALNNNQAFRFTVENYGRGIPEKDRELIWQEHYRGKASEFDVMGEGLGLSIVKDICTAYGIEYGYDEKKKNGKDQSIFWVEFPKKMIDEE